nr:S-layer protein fraction 7 [Acetogenium kivui, Peptide Partial, 12 aa] [Thermoanaerobacter kivui]
AVYSDVYDKVNL